MFSRVWTTAKKASPIDLRLVVYGLVAGLILGSLRLGDSTEEATAIGIAAFIEISVGIWLGTKLSLLVLFLVEKRLTVIADRLSALESRLAPISQVIRGHETNRTDKSTGMHIVKLCVNIAPLGILLFTVGAMTAIIDFRVDIHSAVIYFPVLATGVGLASLGLAGQFIFLWQTERRVTRAERRSDLITSTDPFILDTKQLGRTFNRTQSLVCRFAGERVAG